MSVATMVSEEEYLSTSYEHDADWVDGEVIERSMPTWEHATTQARLCDLTLRPHGTPPLFRLTELRVKVGQRYRVLDFCIYAEAPGQRVPRVPPLVAVEILSPDDRMSGVIDRLQELVTWGVPHVWLVDPIHHRLYKFTDDLVPVPSLSVPGYGIEITSQALFAGRVKAE